MVGWSVSALLMVVPLALPSTAGGRYDGSYCKGEGDAQFLRLVDESFSYFHPTPDFPNISMLYRADWDSLSEGPMWGLWWIQNSYGPTFCALPFLQEPWLTALQHSQDFWFKHQADGKRAGMHQGVVPPDGSLCDAAGRDGVIYVQGDCDWKIHDWCYGFTAAGVLMQAELLLISRDRAAIERYLPHLERACEFIEARRDPANGLFLTGPGSNLLAPSYGGVKQPDGTFGKGYLAEISVTYLAALDRMVELYKLVGDAEKLARYESRQSQTRKSLAQLIVPGGYFVKSIEPDGTRHGVVGQSKYGYFETSVNVDAICHRAVDDAQARKIYAQIEALPQLRPHTYLITNYPSLDDTYANWGSTDLQPIWDYGRWVNGGVWTTLEARAIMAYYRLGRYDDVTRSALRSRQLALDYQFDAPLKNFGKDPWFDNKLTNICYDALGVPAATVRGLFEYVYKSDRLILRPHIPPSVRQYSQLAPVRFGKKQVFISVTNGGPKIGSATVNGRRLRIDSADEVALPYDELPDRAEVRIVMTGGWQAGAKNVVPEVEAATRVRPVCQLPKDLESKYQKLLAMREKLGSKPGLEYEKAFVAEAVRAFDAWRERADIQYAGAGPKMTRKKQAAILRMYRDAALAMSERALSF